MRPRTRASALRLGKTDEVDCVARLLLDLDELEGAGVRMQAIGARPRVASPEAAELLADLAALEGAMHGEDSAGLVLAERGRELDLLCGRRPGGSGIDIVERRLALAYEGKAMLNLVAAGDTTVAEVTLPLAPLPPGSHT